VDQCNISYSNFDVLLQIWNLLYLFRWIVLQVDLHVIQVLLTVLFRPPQLGSVQDHVAQVYFLSFVAGEVESLGVNFDAKQFCR
jgi:hypothetical protein